MNIHIFFELSAVNEKKRKQRQKENDNEKDGHECKGKRMQMKDQAIN